MERREGEEGGGVKWGKGKDKEKKGKGEMGNGEERGRCKRERG